MPKTTPVRKKLPPSKTSRRRKPYLLIFSFLCLFSFGLRIYWINTPHRTLLNALDSRQLPQIASQHAPVDVIRAILKAYRRNLEDMILIDVGAEEGDLATKLALEAKVGYVISVEPDERKFGVLLRLPAPGGRFLFRPVREACGEIAGTAEMASGVVIPNSTCIDCLRESSSGDPDSIVHITTVDNLLGKERDDVLLLKSDTSGDELNIMKGARKTLKKSKFVMVKFDYSAIGTWSNANELIASLRAFRCCHLKFTSAKTAKSELFYGRWASQGWRDFYDFTIENQGSTDLLCIRKY